MVVIITITHHQQLSVFICSRFGFFRWNTHSAIAPLEMLGDGSDSSGSRPTTASLGSSATRTTSSGDQSLGLRSAASGSWGDVCSGPVPRPPEPAPPTAMAPAPPREPTLLPPWHLPRAIPGQPPPPLRPPPQCREPPLCHEPTQGQCICCKKHVCTRHFAGPCMRCAAEPLCHMCLSWEHQCRQDSPLEEPPSRDTPSVGGGYGEFDSEAVNQAHAAGLPFAEGSVVRHAAAEIVRREAFASASLWAHTMRAPPRNSSLTLTSHVVHE